MHYALIGRVSVEIESDWLKNPESVFLTLFDGNDFLAQNALSRGEGRFFSAEEFLQIQALPLAREPLDASGAFQIHIDDRQHFYDAGKLLAMLEIAAMAGNEASQSHASYFIVGEFEPLWRTSAQGKSAHFDTTIPAEQWMELLRLQDMYCLSGQVRRAGSLIEVLGATVACSGIDMVQSDMIVQTQTDPFGRFSIWLHERQVRSLHLRDEHRCRLDLMLSIGAQQLALALDLTGAQRAWHIDIEYAAQDTAGSFHKVKWIDLTDRPAKDCTSTVVDNTDHPVAMAGAVSSIWQYEFPKINLHGARVADPRMPSGKAQLWQ